MIRDRHFYIQTFVGKKKEEKKKEKKRERELIVYWFLSVCLFLASIDSNQYSRHAKSLPHINPITDNELFMLKFQSWEGNYFLFVVKFKDR